MTWYEDPYRCFLDCGGWSTLGLKQDRAIINDRYLDFLVLAEVDGHPCSRGQNAFGGSRPPRWRCGSVCYASSCGPHFWQDGQGQGRGTQHSVSGSALTAFGDGLGFIAQDVFSSLHPRGPREFHVAGKGHHLLHVGKFSQRTCPFFGSGTIWVERAVMAVAKVHQISGNPKSCFFWGQTFGDCLVLMMNVVFNS